ncbi:MAG: exodeoxyribonuclease VII small subunit [Agathobaculum butyriciproducens]|nr:exodeoxyribonuclease VII small subunit [Agathobaculum butyriciproducens]
MAERTFESQMARLEEIVRLLERGEAPLNESMKLFEEGTKLSASLGKLLDKAEQKVTVMQENMQGELTDHRFAAEDDSK